MFGNWKRYALLTAVSSVAALANTAHPGTLNYVEGQATIDGRAAKDGATVDGGQVFATAAGRAEMLLTPGVFLRLGENAAVRMISPGLADTRLEVLQGRALIEATDIRKENRIRVLEARTSTDLVKTGVYRFDADRRTVAVLDGKAIVTANDRPIEVKGGREVDLNGSLEPVKFDKKAAQASDPLYQWSKLRSKYLADAAAAMAPTIIQSGWYGPGWYWYPRWRTWSFLGGSGFYSSPYYWGPSYWGPTYYGHPQARILGPAMGRGTVHAGIGLNGTHGGIRAH